MGIYVITKIEEREVINMNINVDDYLSEETKRDIAEEVFREHLEYLLRENTRYTEVSTILCNAAYRTIWQQVDEYMGVDAREVIAKKVPELIKELSNYYVFNTDYRDRKSVGQQYLDEAIEENKELIKDKTREIVTKKVESLNWKNITDDTLANTIYDVLVDKLFNHTESKHE